MTDELLIYGSYGYTGALITEKAAEEGLSPTLAGRRAEPVERQATDRGLDHRVFSLDHPDVIEAHLDEFDAVLNCAGPFSATAEPMVERVSGPAPTTSTSPAKSLPSKPSPSATARPRRLT